MKSMASNSHKALVPLDQEKKIIKIRVMDICDTHAPEMYTTTVSANVLISMTNAYQI